MSGGDAVVRRMSELLRSGAVMLDMACPLCSAPLFRLKSGEIVCPTHGPVKVVRDDSEAIEIRSRAILDRLEAIAASRIGEIAEMLRGEDDERELLDRLESWLEVLERVRRLKLMAAREERK